MAGIPPVLPTDAEDVIWALQTAEALWKRGERADAIVWLRRAAQSAGDAQDDDRALALARIAADLADWLANHPVVEARAVSSSPPTSGGVDELLRVSLADIPISVSEPQLPMADDGADEPATLEFDASAYRNKVAAAAETAESVQAPTAAQAHAGMLDPWSSPPPLPPRERSPHDMQQPPLEEEEVVTSARKIPVAVAQMPDEPPPDQAKTPNAPPPRPAEMFAPREIEAQREREAPERVEAPKATEPAQAIEAEPTPAPAAAAEPKKPPPLPPRKPPPLPSKPPKKMAARRPRRESMTSEAQSPSQPPPLLEEEGKVYTTDPISMMAAARLKPSHTPPPPGVATPLDIPPTPPAPVIERPRPEETMVSVYARPQDTPTVEAPAVTVEPVPLAEAPPAHEPPKQPATPEPAPPKRDSHGPTVEAPFTLSLDDVPGLSDLPDDQRAALVRAAEIHTLEREEEVGGFGLAMVVKGEVDVAAQIVDVAAERLSAGAVLRGRGSLAEGVPLRLVCASDDAIVATWTADVVDPVLEACPWVQDDLRAQADRVQALVGVTLGPLADRLDASLRSQITSRLNVRELSAGEIVVERGQPVRQMLIVGQGHIELVGDGETTELGAGDILFPAEIIGAGAAPATARAGKGGALVLEAERSVAQELMVTCPPLLEIFAGM